MTPDFDALIHGYLDGTLTAAEEESLNTWIKAGSRNAAKFAEAARLHDRLACLCRSRATEPASAPRTARRWGRLAVAVLAASVVFALWLWSPTRQVNAADELQRLIDAPHPPIDRVYRIDSLDPNPAPTEPRQPPIDGATLYVRAPDRYVLVRRFPDGRPYVTGYDGERNWDVPPGAAPVRLSRDPLRFRWALPGHQHGIPFADLRSDLVQLRDAYTLSVLPTDAAGLKGLRAEKKSAEYRGPKRVELWYDGGTGVISRMTFGGLPRARGGPTSVAVNLIEQRDLGADFFRHDAHHTPDRRVIEEDWP